MRSVIPDYDPDKNKPTCPLCGVVLTADNWRIAGIRAVSKSDLPSVIVCKQCWPERQKLASKNVSIVAAEGGGDRMRWHTFATAEATA